MNTPASIELAIATLIRDNANLPTGVTIRAWQTLEHDATWDNEQDRTFPMIEVRCSPPRTDDNQSTLSVDCGILIGTMTADDKNHAVISDMYSEVQDVIDRLYSQFRLQSFGNEYDQFVSVMADNIAASKFRLGGFSYGDPQVPFEDRGANMIGITLTIHFSRDDF